MAGRGRLGRSPLFLAQRSAQTVAKATASLAGDKGGWWRTGCLYPDVPTRGTDAVGAALGKGPGQSEVPLGGPEKQQEIDPCPVSGQTALDLGFVMGAGTPLA